MDVLVVDVGGTHVKILATHQQAPRKFVSGPTLTAAQMVMSVKHLARDWKYDVVSIGYPGPVLHGKPVVGAAQSRARLGRIRLQKRVRLPCKSY